MSAARKEKATSPGSHGAPKHDESNRRANADRSENVVFLHPAATEPSPTSQYLDRSVGIEGLPIPLARFSGLMGVVPQQETIFCGISALLQEIAPDPAPVVERKDQVPYYI